MTEFTEQAITIEHQQREIHLVMYAPQTEEKVPFVIFSHGFNGTHVGSIEDCRFLASHGIGAIALDFNGGSIHLKNSLTTDEMTIFTEKEDLHGVINFAQKQAQVDAENIFLFGESQGGLVTALVADERTEDFPGILLLFPAFCVPDDWRKQFPVVEEIPALYEFWGVTLGRNFFTSIHTFDVFEHIGKYEKPVLIFHGDQDEVVGVEYSQKAQKLYPQAQLNVYKNEGHGFSKSSKEKVMQQTLAFVQKNSSKKK